MWIKGPMVNEISNVVGLLTCFDLIEVPETWTGKRIINAQVDVKEIASNDGDGGDQVQLDLGGLSLDDFEGVDLDRVIEDAVAMNNVPTGLITLFKEELRRKLTKNN